MQDKEKRKIKKKPASKKNKNCTSYRLKLEWIELDFTSKMVLLIGFVLFVELISAIFFYSSPDNDALAINIAFRTGLSSVLGYLLGGMNAPVPKDINTAKPLPPTGEKDSISAQTLATPESTDYEPDINFIQHATTLRTLLAAIVCLVCILTLVAASSLNRLEYTEGIIQLRTLISTTIGFLISKSAHKSSANH